jgi:hypothetical protein
MTNQCMQFFKLQESKDLRLSPRAGPERSSPNIPEVKATETSYKSLVINNNTIPRTRKVLSSMQLSVMISWQDGMALPAGVSEQMDIRDEL